MEGESFLTKPQPAPELHIPSSSATVVVRVIDSTVRLDAPLARFVDHQIKGHDRLNFCPSYAFLVSNDDRHVVFDLGIRKDLENLPPAVHSRFEKFPFDVRVEKDVADILDENAKEVGVSSKDIEAVIWSHHHWDHYGNIGTFPSSTALVIGPGLKQTYTPAYPTNPKSTLLDSYFEGREIREIDFANQPKPFKIADVNAMDFFGDGSFFLLDTPGHTTGHLCGLARVTSSPDSFVFMGGDVCHHVGHFRPTEYLPIPKKVFPSPLEKFRSGGCPGELLQEINRDHRADKPFYGHTDAINEDLDNAAHSGRAVELLDASNKVLIVIAHDATLLGQIQFFPDTINDWYTKGVDSRTRWRFCQDFSAALSESESHL